MLKVKTPEEVAQIIREEFLPQPQTIVIPLMESLGRILAADILADAYVPDFNRSTVDGYAVRAADTFGCSDSIPALLTLNGQVHMGESADFTVEPDTCGEVPTGGELPQGADAMVMVEYTEDYGDGTIGILKPAAPGANIIFRGDDVKPSQKILSAGQTVSAQAIGAMAAMGITSVPVADLPKVGIISTGDELVSVEDTPKPGQIRDINSSLLASYIRSIGAVPISYGMVRDEETLLMKTVEKAICECDMVLISGGSSVGAKDATCKVIEHHGSILFHGIAMKPGKPTILGKAGNKPIFGLPGHPAAAFFVTRLFVKPTLYRLMGRMEQEYTVNAILTESVSANHGRAQYMGVNLSQKDHTLYATPIRSKSGLISTLANSDGFLAIHRDCEGLAAGTNVMIYLY